MTAPLVVGVPRELKEGEHRVAITPDGVHELLLRLGDLTRDEIAARTIAGAHVDEWLEDLTRERRVVNVNVG